LFRLEQERKDAERAQKDAAENKKKPKKPKPGPSEPGLTTAENAKERAVGLTLYLRTTRH